MRPHYFMDDTLGEGSEMIGSTPVNETPVLMCEGECQRFTQHRYTQKTPNVGMAGLYIMFIFQCNTCAKKRIFGNEDKCL